MVNIVWSTSGVRANLSWAFWFVDFVEDVIAEIDFVWLDIAIIVCGVNCDLIETRVSSLVKDNIWALIGFCWFLGVFVRTLVQCLYFWSWTVIVIIKEHLLHCMDIFRKTIRGFVMSFGIIFYFHTRMSVMSLVVVFGKNLFGRMFQIFYQRIIFPIWLWRVII